MTNIRYVNSHEKGVEDKKEKGTTEVQSPERKTNTEKTHLSARVKSKSFIFISSGPWLTMVLFRTKSGIPDFSGSTVLVNSLEKESPDKRKRGLIPDSNDRWQRLPRECTRNMTKLNNPGRGQIYLQMNQHGSALPSRP